MRKVPQSILLPPKSGYLPFLLAGKGKTKPVFGARAAQRAATPLLRRFTLAGLRFNTFWWEECNRFITALRGFKVHFSVLVKTANFRALL